MSISSAVLFVQHLYITGVAAAVAVAAASISSANILGLQRMQR
jgi:hypothetical protein